MNDFVTLIVDSRVGAS